MRPEVDYIRLSKTLKKYKLPPYYGNMGNHEYYDVWVDRKGKINKDSMLTAKQIICRVIDFRNLWDT